MFVWLRKLWRKLFGVSRPERDVFTFRTGGVLRQADPLAAWRSFERLGGLNWVDAADPLRVTDFSIVHPLALEAFQAKRRDAIEKLVGWVRSVFNIPPFESGGATEAELLTVLAEYIQFMTELESEFRPFFVSSARASPSILTDAPGGCVSPSSCSA